MVTVWLGIGFHLIDKLVNAFGGHLGSQVPVERRRSSSLLHVAQDVDPTVEDSFAFLIVQMVDEICGVILIGLFVPVRIK